MHEFLKREREELKKVSYEERRLFLEVSNTALRFVDYDEPLVGDIGSPRKIGKYEWIKSGSKYTYLKSNLYQTSRIWTCSFRSLPRRATWIG